MAQSREELRRKKREYQREYRMRHPDRIKESKKTYYQKNKDRIKAITAKRYRDLTPEERKSYNRKNLVKCKYGLEWDEYLELIKDGCQICEENEEDTRLCIDHCHKTGRVRGALCHRCNSAIGLLRDRPDLCEKAGVYLKEFNNV